MNFFDLHCDTLYEICKKNEGLYDNSCHVSLKKSENINKYIGCFAIWMPDEYRGKEAVGFFDKVYEKFVSEKEKNVSRIELIENPIDMEGLPKEKRGVILTVEGGAALGGDLERVGYLKKCGVRAMTLTWNGENEIGGGSGERNPIGITEFGIKVVKEMEKQGIIVDVSHAGEKLFYDVSDVSKRPFMATHSNSYSVCSHRRNLKDKQFQTIRDRGGIVGVTFCNKFLNSDTDASISDIMRHIEHFLSLDGENTVAIGSDFDGTDVPDELKGIESMGVLYEYMLRCNYSEELVRNIFYKNAYNFFRLMI